MLYAPEARDSLPRGRTARRVRRIRTAHLGTTGPRQPRGRPCARLGAPALLHRRAARDAGRLGAARHGLLRTATATEALPSARWAMHYGGAPRPRACALHVYRMCTACVLHMHCLRTACALPAHCLGLTRTCTAALLGARRADQLGILRARHRLPGNPNPNPNPNPNQASLAWGPRLPGLPAGAASCRWVTLGLLHHLRPG